ncbi:MAG TPA: diguanylate cyclase [Rheinheimera sp.]|nr:diguanylate cyclase [Rheinheimera sp.]
MPHTQAQLEQQLAQLQQQYLQRLATDLPALQDKLLELSVPDVAWREVSAELVLKFHTLAGSAGTFGLAETGVQAKKLELLFKNLLAQQQPPSHELFQQALGFFHAMRAAANLAPVVTVHGAITERNEHAQTLIYLLEDDVDAANHVCLTLATFGYQVQWFSQTNALAAALAEREPDALIIDIELQHEAKDGLEFVQQLQQRRAVPLPLFVVTQHTDFEHYLAAVRAGALGYFNKPLNAAALEARLQRLFSERHRDAFRVLIVDDDLMLARHYALVLQSAGLRAEIISDPAEIFAGLNQFHPDVIILDVNMPGCTGPELAQLVRLQDEWLGVPIIYLSSETDSERQLAVLIKAGDDFLTKPISDNALVVAIFARAQRARQLADVMTRDSLTGLLQHAHIKERLQVELERTVRSEQTVSVVMLDIDHFKKVNDKYGHLVGDQVITSLANLLRQQLRKTDMIGRYGGEEFLLVLPDCPLEKAYAVVDQLRQAFARFPFVTENGSFHCTFSAGICDGSKGELVDQVIDQADQALYISKASGRNKVTVFSQN